MAVFTSSKTQYQFYLKLTMEETVTGAYNSQPQVSYKLQLYSGGWNFSSLRINAHVKLGGAVIAQLNATDEQWTLGVKSNITLLRGTASVPYDGSGSLQVEYAIDMDESYWQYAPDIKATGTMPLTPYSQPASEPSLSTGSIELDQPIIISTNRKDAYSHIISYTFGSASGIIATGVGDSVSWTPPLTLANQIPNDPTGICIISCETFSGGSSVGTRTVNLELKVPASVAPTITAFTAIRVDNGVPSSWGIYVKGYSKVRLLTTAAGAYGSTIQSYSVSGGLSGSDVTTGVLNTVGENKFSVTVKDSRGRIATANVSIIVVDYTKPSISSVFFARCDANGTDNDDGTSIKVYGVIAIDSCEGKNSYTAQVQYKLSVASSWIKAGNYASGNTSVYVVGLTDETYDVRIVVTDGLNTVYATDVLDVGDVIAEYHKDTGVLEFLGPLSFGDPNTTRANLGAAPAGYGLGIAEPTKITDCNTATKSGWYRFDYPTANAPTNAGGWLQVSAYSADYVQQTYYNISAAVAPHGVIACRFMNAGTWTPWEFLNPPMVEGVEYRTTERWNGKVVYTKLVDCGYLPNNSQKYVWFGNDIVQVIRCVGVSLSGNECYPSKFGNSSVHIYGGGNNIIIDTTYDASDRTCYGQVWYVKD